MNKKHDVTVIDPVIIPEVMRPEKQNLTTGADLQNAARQLQTDVSEMGRLENHATFLALRIGLNLIGVKNSVQHGGYESWLCQNVPELGFTQARYYRKLAEDFIEVYSLEAPQAAVLIETNPEAPEQDASGLVQMAFDFLGDKSLNQIFAERGIKKQALRGGARPGAGRPRMDLNVMAETARKDWLELHTMLRNLMAKRGFVHLKPSELESLYGDLIDVQADMRAAMKGVQA